MKKEDLHALEQAHQQMMVNREQLAEFIDHFTRAQSLATDLLEQLAPKPLRVWEAQPVDDKQWNLTAMSADAPKE